MNALWIWARRWGVNPAAMSELARILDEPPSFAAYAPSDLSEAAVQSRCRLEAPRSGSILWRNNSGEATDVTGRPVRYGLANDSKRVNASIKSSDLIGICPVVVKPRHVGSTLGVFLAVEVKPGRWRGVSGSREAAQLNYLQIVNSLGGYGMFCHDSGALVATVKELQR